MNKLTGNEADGNSLLIVTTPEKFSEKERTYLELRRQEGRVYTDEEVELLPEISPNHPLAFEWKIRKHSGDKLAKYLSAKNRPLTILEIGCGNGWLSHRLAKIAHSKVTGLDINLAELEQAARVFSAQSNLQFIYADIFDSSLDARQFDIIIIAAVIPYFPEPEKLINRLLSLLAENGEIHIIDSPLYATREEASDARQRSLNYFTRQKMPTMHNYYFHHARTFLKNYSFRKIEPALWERLSRKSLFPWIIIDNAR